jgi:hypothetical protein
MRILFIVLAALPLGGCVYAAAAGVAGNIASQAAGGGGAPTVPDPAAARAACTERASQHGEVRIIDAVVRGEGVRVWGTAGPAEGPRRSFRCEHRGGRVTGFTLGGVARAG